MDRMMKQGGGFRPRLQFVEVEGHGRAFEVYENGEYVTTFDQRDGREVRYPDEPGPTIGQRYGGRVAEVYGFKAYEAECAKAIDLDPAGYDLSEVMPAPFLVTVREQMRELPPRWGVVTEDQEGASIAFYQDLGPAIAAFEREENIAAGHMAPEPTLVERDHTGNYGPVRSAELYDRLMAIRAAVRGEA